MIGWFSEQSLQAFGGSIYIRPDGSEVLVSEVTNTEQNESAWPDNQCIGPVVKWVRRCECGKSKMVVTMTWFNGRLFNKMSHVLNDFPEPRP